MEMNDFSSANKNILLPNIEASTKSSRDQQHAHVGSQFKVCPVASNRHIKGGIYIRRQGCINTDMLQCVHNNALHV